MAKTSLASKLEICDWDLLGYGQSLSMQKDFVEKRLADRSPDRLILVEHPSVVTIGRRGNSSDLQMPAKFLSDKGIELYFSDRGGRATYHGPGQMVAYPIIELKNRDLNWYVQTLLEAIAFVLKNYGLEPVTKKGNPGLWIENKKIASIGIAVKKWVTYHGVALNVNTDLTAFNWFVPCGHPDEIFTSMEKELGHSVSMSQVKQFFIHKFCELFNFRIDKEKKHPNWLKLPPPKPDAIEEMEKMLRSLRLGTVCQSARCPNISECFSLGTVTFLILGKFCTRNCRFCGVSSGRPEALDNEEPVRVALAVQNLNLKYVVITSVTRDDLVDGGANQFVRTIENIRRICPGTNIEILVPDFNGSTKYIRKVCATRPEMFSHNIETVPRLYPLVRPEAHFARSLKVLSIAAEFSLRVKSGLMLGLGERHEEIIDTLNNLRRVGCEYLTIGQYLAPSKQHVPVDRYVSPEEFNKWAEISKNIGFKEVVAGPLIRSSYRADKMFCNHEQKCCCAAN